MQKQNKTAPKKTRQLRRSLGLPLVALYGLGNILGAGIYVLVGKVAGTAGSGATLSFLVAMFVAALTAFSYMELSGRYPVSASVSVYLHKAFGRKLLSVAIGLAMVSGGIVSASALAHGFAGYLGQFIAVPDAIASVGILIVIGLVAIKGINESARLAALFTCVEIIGLLLVIWAGRSALGGIDMHRLLTPDPSLGWAGVFAGAFLAFYAFIGFEDMVNVAEEARNPRRTMPIAILISLVLSTLLYLAVVVVATTVVPPAELAKSSAPLSLVTERSGASLTTWVGLIGITAAVNGIVVQIIMGSRILYGLARQGWITGEFAEVNNSTKTPVTATVAVVAIMIVATLLLPLVSLAKLTSLLILSIFAFVNIALYVIKRRQKNHQGYITVPQAVPVLGAATSIGLIVYQVAR